MKKSSIYTKTGDTGTTGLVGGSRVKKSDNRIHLYGEVDELNASIGIAISFLDEKFDRNFLTCIQKTLFDIGSNLATEKEKRIQFKLPQVLDTTISEIEQEIDDLDSSLPLLTNFILPGGDKAAACFHLARTICRRVERNMVDFEDRFNGEVPYNVLVFMNRLSDYFFVLSRYLNKQKGISEIDWIADKK